MTSLILSLIILSLIALLAAVYTLLVELADDEAINLNNFYRYSYDYRLDTFVHNPEKYLKYSNTLTERN